MKKPTSTIRDVATAAGVSTTTVSKFVNGLQRFTPAVEAAITAAIAELGYRANPVARSMVTGRTRSICLSVLDIHNPHCTSIVKGANRVAIERHYNLLLVDTEDDHSREQRVLEELASRVDGMLIFSRLPEAQMARLLALGKPLVLFGRPQGLDVSWVASEDHRGAYMLARHLVSLGHRRIAYLGFSRSRRDAERMAGLRACLDSHGLALTLFDCATPTADDGHHACASIMLGRERPDALVCFNDLMAMGFMKAAQVLGFKLPRDISVAGFDNIEFGKYMSPPLTSVDLRSEAMGAAAMRKLIAALDGTSVDETIIEPKLIVRGSTLVRQRTPLAVPAVAA